MATLMAGIIARAQREVRAHFENSRAFDADHAVTYECPDALHQRQFDLLVGRGVLQGAGEGRYYIDRALIGAEQRQRRRAVRTALALIVVGVLIAILVAAVSGR